MSLFDIKKPFGVIDYVIGFLIFVQILVAGLPLIFDNMEGIGNISDMPFASFFARGGVLFIVLGAIIIKAVIEGTKHKR